MYNQPQDEIIMSLDNERREMNDCRPESLQELLTALKNNEINLDDTLPTFGGKEPADTSEVWSWDATHLIVGTCVKDIEIISQDNWDRIYILGWDDAANYCCYQ